MSRRRVRGAAYRARRYLLKTARRARRALKRAAPAPRVSSAGVLALFAALAVTGCVSAPLEDDRFGAAEVTFHALNAVDQAQSINAISRDCYREVDWLTADVLGPKPSSSEFVLWGVAISAAFHVFNRLEWVQERPALRATVDAVLIGAKGYVVARNHNIGMRVSGPNKACL
jgi:hypothetical protein